MTEYAARITTRPEARSLGFNRYFTGKPCKHGHLSERFVKCASCKECKLSKQKTDQARASQVEYRGKIENKRAQKNRVLQYLYGITLEDFEAMLSAQGGKCAICEMVLKPGRGMRGAVVDHCHPTGKVRGILCNQCNRGLGFFRESAHMLRLAAAYMAKGLS